VLIGLSGAGKSTVAPRVAELLGSGWVDIDDQIAAAAGITIPDIFAQHGEAHFRALERDAVVRAVSGEPGVVAVGAGWAAEPGNLATVAGKALVLYLSVSPREAARRLAGATDRPLLGPRPDEARLAAQLALRGHWYQLADLEIAAGDASPEGVAAGVATAARQYGGW
jgi:shikimate kinase